MAVRMKPVLQAMVSFLAASGRCPGGVSVGEPKSPVEHLHAAVILGRAAVEATTLTTTIERREVIVRLYLSMLGPEPEAIEYALDDAYAELVEDLCANFDLDAAGVRNLDVTGIGMEPGYISIGQTMHRTADITIPLVIDDSASFAA